MTLTTSHPAPPVMEPGLRGLETQALLRQVERVARSEATVLIVGETGTGKELIARHVHETSGRKGPFVAVNCGAFSDSLIDAELFGHEAGAYTGAKAARAGWFESANGGTLFLDEIGDLSPPLQVKLLRVLQERQVVRIGARSPISLDVRLVAATNIDLIHAVQAQQFRADLFYRLSVAQFALPPLRERRGEILTLAEHFIATFAPRLGLGPVRIDDEARAMLLRHVWPGNVRELENVIHFALIVCSDDVIRAGDLRLAPVMPVMSPAGPPAAAAAAPVAARAAAPQEPLGDDLQEQLETLLSRMLQDRDGDLYRRVEETLLRSAYAACAENQVHTARALGLTRHSLRTLLKRHGMLAGTLAAEHIEADEPHPVTH